MTARSRNEPSEKEVQRRVRALYVMAGCSVWDTSDYRAVHVTPGVPDLIVMCPRKRAAWFHELKSPCGKVSADQLRFAVTADRSGWTVLIGGYDMALAHLRTLGLLPAL